MKLVRWIVLVLLCTSLIAAADQKTKKPTPSATQTTTQLIDINNSDKDALTKQLKTLDGIGDAYSAAIVKGQPYANKTQLISRGILPQSTYDKIKDKAIAKQPPKKKHVSGTL